MPNDATQAFHAAAGRDKSAADPGRETAAKFSQRAGSINSMTTRA